jgi:adenylyl-sulfate kinase
MSGAGKSTLSARVADELRARGQKVEVLDGDEIREHMSKGLGFTKADRDTNVKRIGYVCKLLTRNGVWAVSAAISPYRDTRAHLRNDIGRFIEIYVECSLEKLAERDVKGLYKKAMAGEIAHFTGVSDPYEPPTAPEITVNSERQTVDESFADILAYLERRGLIPARHATRS